MAGPVVVQNDVEEVHTSSDELAERFPQTKTRLSTYVLKLLEVANEALASWSRHVGVVFVGRCFHVRANTMGKGRSVERETVAVL